jgi:DNA-binding response OmpR family regulator
MVDVPSARTGWPGAHFTSSDNGESVRVDNQVALQRADNTEMLKSTRDPESAMTAAGAVTEITRDGSTAILLAEDDPVTRMLMTRFLKKAGYEVDAVADGTEALEHMTKRYYPLLVTDWEMPEMDGIELCKAVRNLQLDGYVYALLLTARNAKEHIIAGLEAGADDYLVKPVHEPELVARLNTGRRILALEHSLRAANERNRILSITDALTGAFNRRYMMEQLPRELERCRRYANPLSVIMCDVDHFKQVNDVKGHSAGDDVLQQFVWRMQKSIRATSDWVARIGGEEVRDRAARDRPSGRHVRRREDPHPHERRAVRDPRGRRGGDQQFRCGLDRAARPGPRDEVRDAHPRGGSVPLHEQAVGPQPRHGHRDPHGARADGEPFSPPRAAAR